MPKRNRDMRLNRFVLSSVLIFSSVLAVAQCEDLAKVELTTDDTISSEANEIATHLRESLEIESEAIAMLNAIVNGSTLNGEDGWFPIAKAQSRFEWKTIAQVFDTNADGKITQEEFGDNTDHFSRLDRSGDMTLSESDFVWHEHSLVPTPGFVMFFMADQDTNGKVTRDEFMALFNRLAGADSAYLALDDVRDQFQPPPPGAREKRADRPTRSTLIKALRDQELGSLQPGPKVGDEAPNFTLRSLKGESVTLSQEIGEKPIVLIFGNFTCGPFRSQAGNLEKLYNRYQDRAKFFVIYVREAHPKDGWWMLSNQRSGIDLLQPTVQRDRQEVAQKCQAHLGLSLPFLVDEIDDKVGSQYSGMPNRLYLIDEQGKVAFKNGRGPFGFHPRQLEQSLVLLLSQSVHSVDESK